MTVLYTPRFGLPYPDQAENADVPADFQALAERVETILPGVAHDIGDLKFSARTTEHGAWIIANGRALPPGNYPQLRAAILADGSPFGSSGADPIIPDMRGRAPVGANIAAGVPGIGSGYPHGLKFGVEQVTLAIAQVPSHNHGGATGAADRSLDHTHGYTYPSQGFMQVQGGSVGSHYHFNSAVNTGGMDRSIDHLHGISAQGGGQSHENRMPMQVATWFVYAGPAT